MTSDPCGGRCAVCDSPSSQRCGPCATAGFDLFFCSPEHQKLVWKTHRQVCGTASSPFLPPDPSAEEDEMLRAVKPTAKTFPSLRHRDDKKAATVLWNLQYVEQGTPTKIEAAKLERVVLFGAFGFPGTTQCQPRLKQAVLLQAYAKLYQLVPASARLHTAALGPMHHTAALYTAMRLIHPDFTDPEANYRLLHALLILFTLVFFETRPEGPPGEYDQDYLLTAVRSVVSILSTSGICVDAMSDAFTLFKEAIACVATFAFDVSGGEGTKKVSIKRLAAA
ncbi:hypothetical protein JCM3770_001526 [Rhodotorula araucariae]